MDKENLKDVLTIFAILLFLSTSSFALGFKFRVDMESSALKIGDYYGTNCSNLSLTDTASCLNKELKSFYNYNLSNIGKHLTLEELKAQGGVCSHASNWYKDNIDNSTTYSSKYVYLSEVGNSSSHVFIIMYGEEGYCILDQRFKLCNLYG